MRQALHIFKKDARHLRYDVALILAVASAFCLLGMRDVRGPGPMAFVLPVIWWFLLGRVIHLEALPGKRQYWLTRPYERGSLLGAKLLFIAVFVNLPLLLADVAILYSNGFSFSATLAGLLWTQVLLVAAFVLPAAAVSAITNGLIEFLIVSLLLVFGFLAWALARPFIHLGSYWMEMEWVRTCWLDLQLALLSGAILAWQYRQRKTKAARAAALATLLLAVNSALLPWTAAFRVQSGLSHKVDLSSLRIELDARQWLARVYENERGDMVAELPLHITGIPAGAEVKPNGAAMQVEAANGRTWVVDDSPSALVDFEDGVGSLRALMPKQFYAAAREGPARVRGTLYFTLYARKLSAPVPLNGERTQIAALGICGGAERYVFCNSPFRSPRDSAILRVLQESARGAKTMTEKFVGMASYSPFPAEFNINPIDQFFSARLSKMLEAGLETSEPVAHAARRFEISGVRLCDFERTKEVGWLVGRPELTLFDVAEKGTEGSGSQLLSIDTQNTKEKRQVASPAIRDCCLRLLRSR